MHSRPSVPYVDGTLAQTLPSNLNRKFAIKYNVAQRQDVFGWSQEARPGSKARKQGQEARPGPIYFFVVEKVFLNNFWQGILKENICFKGIFDSISAASRKTTL